MREPIRLIACIDLARKRKAPIGKLEAQRIPALRAPALSHASPLEHQVFAASLRKVIAHREAGLAAADDHRLDLLH